MFLIKNLIFDNSKWWRIGSNANISFDDNKPVFNWTRVSTAACKRASYSRYSTEENLKANFSDWETYPPSHGRYIGRAFVDFNDIGKTEMILYYNDDDFANPITFVRAEDATVSENGGVTSLLSHIWQWLRHALTRNGVSVCL